MAFLKDFFQNLKKAGNALSERGFSYTINVVIAHTPVFDNLLCHYYRIFKKRTFAFEGKKFSYFYHTYNVTWHNERAIEVPIAREFIESYSGKKILEIGNVLSHYFSADYDIVDKYEKARGVVNQDVVKFRPSKKYDLILAISTLEHVGWDEKPREPQKILRAIQNLKTLLAQNGKIVVTLPMGHSPALDDMLRKGKITFTKKYFFKRISSDNLWKEVPFREISNAKYNYPFPAANGLVIGIIDKK